MVRKPPSARPQRAGRIQYSGHVPIFSRAELENACCECYRVIQRQLGKLAQRTPASCASVNTSRRVSLGVQIVPSPKNPAPDHRGPHI
jgi:hypothetical protein